MPYASLAVDRDHDFQVSAKDATNVDPAFGNVALLAYDHFKQLKAEQEARYDLVRKLNNVTEFQQINFSLLIFA